MTPETIRKAADAAKEFLARCKPVLGSTRKHQYGEWLNTGKDTGALRRQSLELSRALSEMRKP